MDNKEETIKFIREILPYLDDNQLNCIKGIVQLKRPEIYKYECRSEQFNVNGTWSSIQYIGNKSTPITQDNIVAVRLSEVSCWRIKPNHVVFNHKWFELIDDNTARGHYQGDEFIKVEEFHKIHTSSPIYFNIPIGETDSVRPTVIGVRIDLDKMLIELEQLTTTANYNTTHELLKCKTVVLDFLIRTKKPSYSDDLREMD